MHIIHDSDDRFKFQYTPWPTWVVVGVGAVVGLAMLLSLIGLAGFVFSSLGFGLILAAVAAGLVYFGRMYTADFRLGRQQVVLRKLGLVDRSEREISLEEVASLRTRVSLEETPLERWDLYLTFEDDDRDDRWIAAFDLLIDDEETKDHAIERARGFIEPFQKSDDDAEPAPAAGADAGGGAVSAGTGKLSGAESASGPEDDEEFPGVDQWIPDEEEEPV